MLKTFYKLNLLLADGKTLPVTVATSNVENLPALVESNKMLYSARGFIITGFQVLDIRYPLGMSAQTYEDELSFCDIADED
jgi:hypothetical protein